MSKHHDVGFSVAIGRAPTPTRMPRRPALPVATAPKTITFTGDLAVHVRLGDPGIRHRVMLDSAEANSGPWRRIAMSASVTPCGEQISKYYFATIDESYEGELCKRGCFTPMEIQRAAELVEIASRRRQEESARLEAEREAHSLELELQRERRREDVRRFKTGESLPIIRDQPPADDEPTKPGGPDDSDPDHSR